VSLGQADTRRANRARIVAGPATAVLALLLAGCAGSTGPSSAPPPAPATASASASAHATARPVAATPAAASPTAAAEPTLPPGDPGADAPGVEDPNTAPTERETRGADTARRHVPATALLDAATVGSVTGTTWALTATPADACGAPRVPGAIAARDRALRGSAGQVVEIVATYVDASAARAAVRTLARRLADCAGSRPSDPRVGDASVQATVTSSDGSSTVVTAVAAEGVLAVLSGTGPVSGAASWPSLTDLALGNTCIATRDGCH
jgi:hypothetical protein